MSVYLTGGEALLVVLSLAALFAAAARCCPTGWRAAAGVALLSLPALYLAAERGSQFTTADEQRILSETLQWARGSAVREWNLGAFRTSTALLAPVARVVRTWPDAWRLEDRLAFLKNFHWFCGFLVFLGLVVLTHQAFELRHRPVSWLMCVYGMLLLPVHLMALKIVNYDEFALQLSVLSLLLIIVACRDDRLRYAQLAVGVAYLGAQEKLSASPFLLLAMAAFAYLVLRRGWSGRRLVYAVLGPLVICGAAGGLTTLVALATRSFDSSGFRAPWLDLLDPLISWVWIVHRFVLEQRDLTAYRWLDLGVVVATFLGGACVALVLRSTGRALAARWTGRRRSAVLLGLLLFTFLVGLWGTFGVVGYWHPYHPLLPGQFDPGGEMNRATLHFAADSRATHLLRASAFHYAVFFNALPTALLGLAVWVLLWRMRRVGATGLWPADLLLLLAPLVPGAYALLSMPFGHRYMNFALLLLAVAVIASYLKAIEAGQRWWHKAVAGLVGVAITLEVLPFAPAYFPFRPIWSPHAYPDALVPEVGRLNPTWLGWGEETMLGGELLAQWVRTGRIPATPRPVLYVAYYAPWLNPSSAVEVKSLTEHAREIRYADNEYFLVNRSTYVQNARAFPAGVPPEDVISFRGYVQAWIFRGDKLKAAGFRF
jgi:hypothetical protein